MEGLLVFNKHLLYIVVFIVGGVAWLMGSTLTNFDEFNVKSSSSFYHSSFLEVIWTSVPALVLLKLSSPSFSLLYSTDEISTPELTIKIIGHQWFWSYEMSDFDTLLKSCKNSKFKTLKYTCYLLSEENILENKYSGFFRLLETNKRIMFPLNTHLRLLVTSMDVLHSWTIPSLGIKIDACPGRLNQVNIFLKRIGMFFGQCSEICGVNHGFMPIVILVIPSIQYHYFLVTKIF